MSKVFVVNQSPHNFKPAAQYGELVFMSEGSIDRFATNRMIRQFTPFLAESSDEDHLVISGPTVMNVMAAVMLARKHGGVLNILLERRGSYVQRALDLSNVRELEELREEN